MKTIRWLAVIATVAILGGDAAAQKQFSDVAKATVEIIPAKARPGEAVIWRLTIEVVPGWHTYPTKQDNEEASATKTKIVWPKQGDLIFVGDLVEKPAPTLVTENGVPTWEIEGTAVFERTAVINPKARPGTSKAEMKKSLLLVCKTNVTCFNDPPPVAEVEVLNETAIPVASQFQNEVEEFLKRQEVPPTAPPPTLDPKTVQRPATPEVRPIALPAATLEEHQAGLDAVKAQLEPFAKSTEKSAGLFSFLATAALWGLISLVTPCVFPMIPITVSFFLKQSEKEHHKPIRMASIYCGTIILVLGLAALTLLTFFRALSINPITNVALGLLFLVFALSLFGMYDITLPQSLTNFTASREGRGGVIGTVFMALTFTIVSFTCVAPFLGGFAGMQASGQYSKLTLLLGAMAFSTTFAAPFFVLALFPSLLKKLPKSGSWLNSVKVVMGFLEVAAALKFFRTAELGAFALPSYFTYDLVLAIWVGLAVLCGLYLLNVYRLGHDSPLEHIGVVRMLFGLGFLSLAVYLVPALFKHEKGDGQRPGGVVYSWIDSFLLPEPGEDDMPYSANLKGTVDAARKELEKSGGKRQFIFLDYTGKTCTNCKYNERNVFRGETKKLMLEKYWLVQQYTDWVPARFYDDSNNEDHDDEALANKRFQREQFGTEQLPLYVVLEVKKDTVKIHDVYDEGKINNVSGFKAFLQKPLK